MRTRTLALTLITLALLAAPAHAGDCPLVMLNDDWGIGEISGRFIIYTGKDSYIDTPIPTVSQRNLLACLTLAGLLTAATYVYDHVKRRRAPIASPGTPGEV